MRQRMHPFFAAAKYHERDRVRAGLMRVLAAVGEASEPVKAATIAAKLSVPRRTAQRWIKRLKDDGLLECCARQERQYARGKTVTYRLRGAQP